jgi:hypothetical protein
VVLCRMTGLGAPPRACGSTWVNAKALKSSPFGSFGSVER